MFFQCTKHLFKSACTLLVDGSPLEVNGGGLVVGDSSLEVGGCLVEGRLVGDSPLEIGWLVGVWWRVGWWVTLHWRLVGWWVVGGGSVGG